MKQADDVGWRWGDQIEEDIMSFNWDGFVKHLTSAHGWWRNDNDDDDDPKSFGNKLWLSDTAKAVTPLHFDLGGVCTPHARQTRSLAWEPIRSLSPSIKSFRVTWKHYAFPPCCRL